MTKANAVIVLTNTLKQFRSVTGECAGAVFSWHGKLGSLGPANFQKFIAEKNDEISRTLVTSKIIESANAKPAHDHGIYKLLDGDIDNLNVPTLRKLVSEITKEAIGKSRTFYYLND